MLVGYNYNKHSSTHTWPDARTQKMENRRAGNCSRNLLSDVYLRLFAFALRNAADDADILFPVI